ncbi:MAG: trigger factor [Acidimicrobiales bacterium]
MHTTSEAIDGTRVRLTVDVDESEMSAAAEKVYHSLQKTMKVKGFRPGKVPRTVMEAHIGGAQALRAYAIEDLISDAYVSAINEVGVEAISDPEVEILSGKEEGPLQIEAIVEVRPSVSVAGYQGIEVVLPSSEVTEEEIESYVDRFRSQWAELRSVDRPVSTGDIVTIDLEVKGGPQGVVHLDDYVYEIGAGSDVPEMDERLGGASPGEVVAYSVPIDAGLSASTGEPVTGTEEVSTAEADTEEPDTGETADTGSVDASSAVTSSAGSGDTDSTDSTGSQGAVLEVELTVKQVEEKVLPALDDAWVRDATDQDSVESLRADVRERLRRTKAALRPRIFSQKVMSALTEYVNDELPSPLVESAFQREIEALTTQLDKAHISLQDYLAAQRDNDVFSQMHQNAVANVKTDLALRALADAEGIEAGDEKLSRELSKVAVQSGKSVDEIRDRYERAGQLVALRSAIRKNEALDWLMHHVHVVDEDGNEVANEVLLGEAEASPVDGGLLLDGAGGGDATSQDLSVSDHGASEAEARPESE